MARILVVDDERSLRRTFALFLRDDGHDVETAEDVDQALAALEQAETEVAQFDVVVSDIILPRRSGVSLLEAIAGRWPDIKVILVTGEPTVETAASAVRSGAYDYISKPVSSATIRRIVGSAIGVKRLQDDNRRLQSENDEQRATLAELVEVRTAEVRDTREALAVTQARISRIASNIPGVLLEFERRTDGTFVFTYLAEGAEPTFGLVPAEVVADPRAFVARVHPEDRAGFRESLARSAETLQLWSWEGRFVLPCGEVRWCQAQSRPALGETGTIVWDGVMLDTSERKDLQARLMQADRMASIGTLAAGVAHEINNPLTYILANLHLLEHRAERAIDAASDDTLELLRETADGARRVRDIARDLKTFSRSSDEFSLVDVEQVLDSSLRMATHELRHRAQVEREYQAIPAVLANPSRLGQVFLNLIVNAAQAIPEGAVEDHRIWLTTSTAADGFAEISVRDTGSGISTTLIDRIFAPFVTVKPIGVGTGLGLWICRDIVAQLGGVIEVESIAGRGSKFTVRLPPAPLEPRPCPLAVAHASVDAPPIRAARILVIDDEPSIGRSLVRSLPEHDLTLADSGRSGLRRLDAGESFDVIFCDVMMPDLGGSDVYEHLVNRHPALLDRVVFMTGGAFTERASEFIDRVRAGRVDKPFEIGTIRAVIRAQLDRR